MLLNFLHFEVLEENTQEGSDEAGNGNNAEGVAPSPVLGNEGTCHDTERAAETDTGNKNRQRCRAHLFRKAGTDQALGSRDIPGLARADEEAADEQVRIRTDKGARTCSQAPEKRHNTQHILAAPSVDKIACRNRKNGYRHIDDGNQQSQLGIGKAHIFF